MAKTSTITLADKKAMVKTKARLIDNLPDPIEIHNFREWLDSEYRWTLDSSQYDSPETDQWRKDNAEKEYDTYCRESNAYNSLLDDIYTMLI